MPRRRSWVERHPIATAAGLMGGAAVVFGAMRRSRAREFFNKDPHFGVNPTPIAQSQASSGPALGAAPISPKSTPAAVVTAANVASGTAVPPSVTSEPPSAHKQALQTDLDRKAQENQLKKIKANNEQALANRQNRLAEDFAKRQQEEEKTLALELARIKEENRLAAKKHQEQLNQAVAEFKAKPDLLFEEFAWPNEGLPNEELPNYNFSWG